MKTEKKIKTWFFHILKIHKKTSLNQLSLASMVTNKKIKKIEQNHSDSAKQNCYKHNLKPILMLFVWIMPNLI